MYLYVKSAAIRALCGILQALLMIIKYELIKCARMRYDTVHKNCASK
ncbi:hypothetical protein HMPREF3190_00407 [Umbribacter vaginalis]|nr:hypothetical protein HMPREF3190_00407 [Coriobacteriales bacterium DNF00809]